MLHTVKTCSTTPQKYIISDEEWEFYSDDGFVVLSTLVKPKTLSALSDELNEIMLRGKEADSLVMQLDSETGVYADCGEQTLGWKKSTIKYRKIEFLENNKVFRDFFNSQLFNEVRFRARIETPQIMMRSMMMNKSPMGGTLLPAHQDQWDHEEFTPTLSIYIALDNAPIESGCMTMYSGSHKQGAINIKDNRGILTTEQLEECRKKYKSVELPLQKGSIVIFNSLCVHESGLNKAQETRRSISCLL